MAGRFGFASQAVLLARVHHTRHSHRASSSPQDVGHRHRTGTGTGAEGGAIRTIYVVLGDVKVDVGSETKRRGGAIERTERHFALAGFALALETGATLAERFLFLRHDGTGRGVFLAQSAGRRDVAAVSRGFTLAFVVVVHAQHAEELG
jgi:hypothetical protein